MKGTRLHTTKPPMFELMLLALDKMLTKRPAKRFSLDTVNTTVYYLGAGEIPGRELKRVITKLTKIAKRGITAKSLLTVLIAKLEADHANFVR